MSAIRSVLALTVVSLFAASASAHYNMLLPDKHSVAKGDSVTFTYQWGHPYEHQLFDAPAPDSIIVVAPDGKATTYPGKFAQPVKLPSGDKKVTAYRFSFKPDQRGDYLVVLKTPPIWMEEEKEFYQDVVKTIVHVQAQKNWDALALGGKEFEFLPLTRPYGLLPGMVFQAQVREPEAEEGRIKDLPGPNVRDMVAEMQRQRPPGALVEIERYNPAAPKELPLDEFITRTVRADPNGVATTTLTEAGWWCLTAARDGGQVQRDGKMVPLKKRTTLWVYVDEKAGSSKK
ncbi:MAG: DUF4198 domain-containing protein [Gemmataceae bacterium]|nr:DUF4198 domain-containing protein [Gemmataceae bacterium]